MTKQQLKQHLIDLLKGLIAAVLVAAGNAALIYIRIHLPDIMAVIAQVGAAIATIQITRRP